jgi:hypothetical protein
MTPIAKTMTAALCATACCGSAADAVHGRSGPRVAVADSAPRQAVVAADGGFVIQTPAPVPLDTADRPAAAPPAEVIPVGTSVRFDARLLGRSSPAGQTRSAQETTHEHP